jgi:hypothetical protein
MLGLFILYLMNYDEQGTNEHGWSEFLGSRLGFLGCLDRPSWSWPVQEREYSVQCFVDVKNKRFEENSSYFKWVDDDPKFRTVCFPSPSKDSNANFVQ